MQRRIAPSPSPLWLNGLENYYDEISAGPTLSCNRAGVNHPSTSFSTFQRGCSRSAGVRSFTQLLTTRVKLPRGSKGAMKLWRFSLPATLCRKSWNCFIVWTGKGCVIFSLISFIYVRVFIVRYIFSFFCFDYFYYYFWRVFLKESLFSQINY